MPIPAGLLFTGLALRRILGVAVVWLFWKIGRLAELLAEKIKSNR